jgi:hypothetical protein
MQQPCCAGKNDARTLAAIGAPKPTCHTYDVVVVGAGGGWVVGGDGERRGRVQDGVRKRLL